MSKIPSGRLPAAPPTTASETRPAREPGDGPRPRGQHPVGPRHLARRADERELNRTAATGERQRTSQLMRRVDIRSMADRRISPIDAATRGGHAGLAAMLGGELGEQAARRARGGEPPVYSPDVLPPYAEPYRSEDASVVSDGFSGYSPPSPSLSSGGKSAGPGSPMSTPESCPSLAPTLAEPPSYDPGDASGSPRPSRDGR